VKLFVFRNFAFFAEDARDKDNFKESVKHLVTSRTGFLKDSGTNSRELLMKQSKFDRINSYSSTVTFAIPGIVFEYN
jgi:hypothetical protein